MENSFKAIIFLRYQVLIFAIQAKINTTGDAAIYHEISTTRSINSVYVKSFSFKRSLSFFSGGYNTRRHGSIDSGEIDAIQIESSRNQRSDEIRPQYAKKVKGVLIWGFIITLTKGISNIHIVSLLKVTLKENSRFLLLFTS